jgi:hypothetical protein
MTEVSAEFGVEPGQIQAEVPAWNDREGGVKAIFSLGDDPPGMHWDGLTLKAFAGATAVAVSAILLLAGGGGPVLPMVGMAAGFAAMIGASLERLKLRVAALESHLAAERG